MVHSLPNMADLQTKTTPEYTNNMRITNQDAFHRQMCEEMYDCLTGVTHHLMTARLQAREADIRARYAQQYAERSRAEALSARQVSVALTETARVVASLALEFIQKTDMVIESRNSHDPMKTESEHAMKTEGSDSDIDDGVVTSKSDGCLVQDKQSVSYDKYSVRFPSDFLVTELYARPLGISPRLETVWECSPSIEDDQEYGEYEKLVDPNQLETETRRKMQIYKDSKRAFTKNYMATGDAQLDMPVFKETGVQTGM